MILTVGIKQKIFLDRSPPIFFTVVCLCATKNRHRGSRDALTHKNSLLTKRREPKPTNSACAEFANQNAGFIGGKTFQGENRQTIQEFCFAEFFSFCTRLLIKQELPDAKARLSLLFDYFAKSRVCLAFPKAKTRFLHKTPAYNRKKHSFLQFWHRAFAQGRAVSVPKRWSG